MFSTFESDNADELWSQVANAYRHGRFDHQKSRFGDTFELLHAALSLSQPRQRWVFSRKPVINVAFALVETVWMIRGRSDATFLNHFNRSLPKFAGTTENYYGAYGKRLRQSFCIDQLERAYHVLSTNPDSRQVVLQIWNPSQDLPDVNGVQSAADIPCNISSLLKVRNGRLEWTQIMRSNDLYRGLPYNLVQFTTLQEVLAGWLRLEVGEYSHLSDSLHVYSDNASCIQSDTRVPNLWNSDNLALPKVESDAAFSSLESLIEMIISSKASAADLAKEVLRIDLPTCFRNQAIIIAAEGVRRLGDARLARSMIENCSNAALNYLFSAWLDRTEVGLKLHSTSSPTPSGCLEN